MGSVEESDVGILCYVSDLPGFRGILKQRYSDFIVNEVDLNGDIVRLTSLEVPLEIAEEKKEKNSDFLAKDHSSDIEAFRALAVDSDVEKLKSLINQISSVVHNDDKSIVLSPSSDKLHRTAVHNFFKERLNFLVTDTVDGPDPLSKCVRVRLNSGDNRDKRGDSRKRKVRGDKPYDCRGSDTWPECTGKFLRFHLYKENKDTMEALGLLGKMLGIQSRSFGFAGTKDKRSASTQRVTVYKQKASRLAVLNERLIGLKVGNFCYVNDGLVLGQLQGNHFTITLRNISTESEDIISASADALGKNGFINYFGLQRFGSGSVPTHLIGASLLRGEWKTAVDLILDPRDGEKDATQKIREYYKETGDIEATLRQLPYHMVAERAILRCFQKCPGNYLQALLGIPRTLRMMFVHSYQSFLWNHAASMRVKRYGVHQIVLGDLVYCKEQETAGKMSSSSFECEHDSGADTCITHPPDDVYIADHSEVMTAPVKVIGVDDINARRYTIYDIVLPLPGSRVAYPSNDIYEVYLELAKKDNISLKDCVHNSKEFSLTNMTGAYRRLFQRPTDFEWELLRYTGTNTPLAETDWDIISKSGAASFVRNVDEKEHFQLKTCSTMERGGLNKDELSAGTEEITYDRENSIQQKESVIGQTALKLAFTLPSSCYATMAIRELLKTSTSVAFHKALSL